MEDRAGVTWRADLSFFPPSLLLSLARPGIYPTLLLRARGHLSCVCVCVCVYQKDVIHIHTVIDKSPRHATDFPSPFFKHSSNEGLLAATWLLVHVARGRRSFFYPSP